jgi:hypothetical protein
VDFLKSYSPDILVEVGSTEYEDVFFRKYWPTWSGWIPTSTMLIDTHTMRSYYEQYEQYIIQTVVSLTCTLRAVWYVG